MPGILGRSLALCPVDGCDVDLAVVAADAAADPIRIRVGQPLSEAIDEASRENAAAREAVLRTHLQAHDVFDFVRTIRRLEQDLYNAGPTGVCPHGPLRRSVLETGDLEAYWASQNEREG